jgi:glycosyltransferase involved in cell wall biosynthesis
MDWLSYIVRSRNVGKVLVSGSAWFLNRAPVLKQKFPGLKIAHILHNDTPASPFRAAIQNSEHIDRQIGVTSKVAAALRAHAVPEQRIVTIANGVDVVEAFDPSRVERNEARRSLIGESGGLLLLWIGRLGAEKRPAAFLDIVETLARQRDVKGLIVGDGPLAEKVRGQVLARNLSGIVKLLGAVKQGAPVAVAYAAADMLVLTSEVEGMPLVVLEALAMGCPVAATDVGDVSKAVQPGKNGVLVDASIPTELAKHILELPDAFFSNTKRKEIASDFRSSGFTQSQMIEAYAREFSEF